MASGRGGAWGLGQVGAREVSERGRAVVQEGWGWGIGGWGLDRGGAWRWGAIRDDERGGPPGNGSGLFVCRMDTAASGTRRPGTSGRRRSATRQRRFCARTLEVRGLHQGGGGGGVGWGNSFVWYVACRTGGSGEGGAQVPVHVVRSRAPPLHTWCGHVLHRCTRGEVTCPTAAHVTFVADNADAECTDPKDACAAPALGVSGE